MYILSASALWGGLSHKHVAPREPRFPGALQHANAAALNRDLIGMCRNDPGSAAHHFVLPPELLGVRESRFAQARPYLIALPTEARFRRACIS